MGLLQSSENKKMVGDYLREMHSSFLFTVIIGLTSDNPRDILIPALAIGLGCAILAESEGAHMNPVISIAITACDPKKGWTEFFLRVLAQLVGCIFGGLTAVDGLRDVRLEFAAGTNSGVDRAVCFEIIFSFILVLVVLRTKEFPSGSFSQGFCYTIAVLAGKTIFSGNSLINPAAAVGIMLGSASYDSSTEESYLWIYLVGPILGSILAILFFQFTELLLEYDEDESSEDEDETTEYVHGVQLVPVHQRDAQREKYQAPGTIQRPVTKGELTTSGNTLPQGSYQRPATRGVLTTTANPVLRSSQVQGRQNVHTAQREYVAPNPVGYRPTHHQV